MARRIAQNGNARITTGKMKPKNATHHLPFIAQTTMQPIVSPATTTPKPAANELASGISSRENDIS